MLGGDVGLLPPVIDGMLGNFTGDDDGLDTGNDDGVELGNIDADIESNAGIPDGVLFGKLALLLKELALGDLCD